MKTKRSATKSPTTLIMKFSFFQNKANRLLLESTRSAQVAGMPEGIAAGLRPHCETVGLFLYRDTFHRSRGGIYDVNHIIVATRQPKHFSIDANIAHIRATAAGDGPVGYDFASRKVDDGDTALPFGGPIHARNASVGHVELRAVSAWIEPVGPETGFDVADLHEFVAIDDKDALGFHISDVENLAIR